MSKEGQSEYPEKYHGLNLVNMILYHVPSDTKYFQTLDHVSEGQNDSDFSADLLNGFKLELQGLTSSS